MVPRWWYDEHLRFHWDVPEGIDNRNAHAIYVTFGDHVNDHKQRIPFPELSRSPWAGSGPPWKAQASIAVHAAENTAPSQIQK